MLHALCFFTACISEPPMCRSGGTHLPLAIVRTMVDSNRQETGLHWGAQIIVSFVINQCSTSCFLSYVNQTRKYI